MSSAVKIYQGRFGRVALLDMDAPLVGHAHHHCHILLKAGPLDEVEWLAMRRHPVIGHEILKGSADEVVSGLVTKIKELGLL